MDKYHDRQHAGKILAQLLSTYKDHNDVLVLALPRGGVPVGFEIAKTLHVPLDVFIVRKLGVPGHSELAMGAIAMGDTIVFNDDIVHQLNITQSEINSVIEKESEELKRRELAYRGDRIFPDVKNKTIILVDDGIATGATMRAAILALRQLNPVSIVVAVPVADKEMCMTMGSLADGIYCPMQPMNLYAVGAWYDNFSQTEDAEVYALLRDIQAHSLE